MGWYSAEYHPSDKSGQAFYILYYNSVIGIQVFSPMVWNFSINPKKESAKANYALLWYFQKSIVSCKSVSSSNKSSAFPASIAKSA